MHIPVLLTEAITALNIREGLTYVDATVGAGGHFFEIRKEMGDSGRLVGFDRDLSCVENLKDKFGGNELLIHSNYSDLKEKLSESGINTVSGGILADLGVSSMQLDERERGFSFQTDAPLDMRMDMTQMLTAEQLINSLDETELSDIIFRYGEERRSRRIAHAIVRARPISSTVQLADIVSKTLKRYKKSGTGRSMTSGGFRKAEKHPATRTFQAIRIAVNQELESLEKFLNQTIEVLEPGARLAVITFHSLEDRIVKQFLKQAASDCICPPDFPVCKCTKTRQFRVITKKPLTASTEELENNPRSRSAKLRIAERL